MPVGVPKTAFLIPDDEDPNCNRLYHERILFLGHELDQELGNQIAGLLIHFTIQDQTRGFFLFINSPGGLVIPGLAVFDTMQWVPPGVTTICMGIAASMASFVLLGGRFTKRLSFPNARVMVHQPATAYGLRNKKKKKKKKKYKTVYYFSDASEIYRLRNYIVDIYMKRTGQPYEIISRDLERDSFMTPEESVKYGIIDEVLYPLEMWEV
nr:clp protease proteolytic subunit [Markhamia cauda-felina]